MAKKAKVLVVTGFTQIPNHPRKTIEYAMGLCWHPDGKRLIISYGFKDCEARLATVDSEEVIRWIDE